MMSKRAGFSLFEVLIAFAILTLVLMALIPGQARLFSRATASDERALALEYAYSRSAMLDVVEPLRLGIKNSQYWSWSVVETTIEMERLSSGQVVEVQILIMDANGRNLAELTSLGFIPDAS